jgi:hypothetical protein
MLVDADEKIDHREPVAAKAGSEFCKLVCRVRDLQVRLQFVREFGFILKRITFSIFFGKKIKGVIDLDVRDEVHAHAELLRLFGKNQPRLPVGKRILLPVQKLLFG